MSDTIVEMMKKWKYKWLASLPVNLKSKQLLNNNNHKCVRKFMESFDIILNWNYRETGWR